MFLPRDSLSERVFAAATTLMDGGGLWGRGGVTARNNTQNIHILRVSSSETEFIVKIKVRGRGGVGGGGGGEGRELGCLD